MPGLLLCFVMRYDNYKKQAAAAADMDQSKITYFHCSLIGYIIGKTLLIKSQRLCVNSCYLQFTLIFIPKIASCSGSSLLWWLDLGNFTGFQKVNFKKLMALNNIM